jgi:hypothetical protein
MSKKTFAAGKPRAATSIEASAKGSAKSVWLRRTNFAYSVIFESGIYAEKIEFLQNAIASPFYFYITQRNATMREAL